MFRNFIFTILTLCLISLSCMANDINQIPSNLELSDPAEAYYNNVLFWIDGDDIPDEVKQFAKQNNCIEVTKSYYWSNKKFKGGSVYSCGVNRKLKYVLEYQNKIRFANWLEFKKLHKLIYE